MPLVTHIRGHWLETDGSVTFSLAYSCQMVAKGKPCKTVHGRLCTLNSKHKGEPKRLSEKCSKCGEWRCRKHCHCGRHPELGNALGRNAPRGPGAPSVSTAKAKAKAAPKAKAVAAPVARTEPIPGPVGRASALSCEKLEKEDFWRRCISDVADASEVELASYMLDEPGLHQALLRRVAGSGRAPFSLRVYVDRTTFAESKPYFQRPRLAALHQKGALVYLCSGQCVGGSFHCKALVIDRRYLYTGNGNFTHCSRTKNQEFLFRMTGPMVAEVLEDLAANRARAQLWDGSS